MHDFAGVLDRNLIRVQSELADGSWRSISRLVENTNLPRSTIERVVKRHPTLFEYRLQTSGKPGRPTREYRLVTGDPDRPSVAEHSSLGGYASRRSDAWGGQPGVDLALEEPSPNVPVDVATGMLTDRLGLRPTVTILAGNGLSTESRAPTTLELKNAVLSTPGRRALVVEWLSRHGRAAPRDDEGLEALFDCVSLEEACLAIAETMGDKVVLDQLRQELNKNEPLVPSLSHEIIAHLAQHGLVHYVVDFNFDELLANVLRDELGGGLPHVYLGEEDLAALCSELDERREVVRPLVIKPHGSISNPDWVKAFGPSVQRYPRFLDNALSEVYRRSDIILIVGYSAQDSDFQNHIQVLSGRDVFRDKFVIWVESATPVPSSIADALKVLDPAPGDPRLPRNTIVVSATPGAFFDSLGEQCSKRLDIPGVARHKIRSEVLHKVPERHQLAAKFITELLILGAKARGYFHLRARTSCSRLMTYLQELNQAEGGGPNAADLFGMLERSELLIPVPDQLNMYTCDPGMLGKQLSDLVVREWLGERIDIERLGRMFADLATQFDIDIDHDNDQTLRISFPGAEPLPDLRSFTEATRRIVEEGDTISVSTMLGEWLVRPEWQEALRTKTLRALIIGDTGPEPGGDTYHYYWDKAEGTREKLSARDHSSTSVRETPDRGYELHITMNEREAIVFRRPYRSPTTSPYLVKAEFVGYRKVKEEFDRMWVSGGGSSS